METIISASISAGVTLLVCLITNYAQSKKTTALFEYRLNELTEQMKKHNDLINRIYVLEGDSKRYTDEFRRVNHRLESLEDDNR